MGLVDENADSDETMMLITEKIFDELQTKHQKLLPHHCWGWENLRTLEEHQTSLWLRVRQATDLPWRLAHT